MRMRWHSRRILWRSLLVGVATVAVVTTASTTSPYSTSSSSNNHKHPTVFPVDEYSFQATIDHFNFRPTSSSTTTTIGLSELPNSTFPLRYFVNEDYYTKSNGNGNSNNPTNTSNAPCFFYAGNEADILHFVNASGFLFEAAREMGALVVFAEHRYYGTSMPFGSEESLQSGDNISFLTVEQAMEDFNTLQLEIRRRWNMASASPFVVFGGSYGGNLALWSRLKNPNLWAGAIASSATPLKHLLRSSNAFAKIETDAYGNVAEACPTLVRQGWKELAVAAATPEGRAQVAQELHLCRGANAAVVGGDGRGSVSMASRQRQEQAKLLPADSRLVNIVHGWIGNALETMVQYGYPYPTETIPVGYPFRVACENMQQAAVRAAAIAINTTNGTDPSAVAGLAALNAAAQVFYNATGEAGDCFDWTSHVEHHAVSYWARTAKHDRLHEHYHQTKEDRLSNSHRTDDETNYMISSRPRRRQQQLDVSSPVIDDDDNMWAAWGYQTCTEVYQPMPTNGVTDFEIPYKPNRTAYFQRCAHRWNVQPRPHWEEMHFLGDAIFATGTNIFLTHGQLDPWRAAGIQHKPPEGRSSDSIVIRTIENGAHHLDLRASHPLDPPSVVAVRAEQVTEIRKWIEEWQAVSHDNLDRLLDDRDDELRGKE